MRYFDDIALGERIALGSHTFTAETIKDFALRFDPQPFHLDAEAAARSHFGALCASGWHTVSVWMRLLVEQRRREDDALRAAGAPRAEAGPAVGFRDLKWPRAVYVGDTIAYASEPIDKRRSTSRPGWGLLTLHNSGVNQDGKPVLSFVTIALVQARPL